MVKKNPKTNSERIQSHLQSTTKYMETINQNGTRKNWTLALSLDEFLLQLKKYFTTNYFVFISVY